MLILTVDPNHTAHKHCKERATQCKHVRAAQLRLPMTVCICDVCASVRLCRSLRHWLAENTRAEAKQQHAEICVYITFALLAQCPGSAQQQHSMSSDEYISACRPTVAEELLMYTAHHDPERAGGGRVIDTIHYRHSSHNSHQPHPGADTNAARTPCHL